MPIATMFRALKHRNFRLYFIGQAISLIGTWMQSVAQSWLIYRLSHSAALLGLTGFVGQIPSLVASPIAGVLADRYSRHRLLLLTQASAMALAFILAVLTLTHTVQIWHILVLSGLLGVVTSVDIPVRQSFVIEMVGKDDLMNAISLNSSMITGTRVIGPAVAGVLVATVGEGWCFFINAVSYIAVIAELLRMKIPKATRERPSGSALAHIAEGIRYANRTLPIRAALALLGLTSFMSMPFMVLMPIFADEILKGGSRGLGILMSSSALGALAGALLLASKPGVKGLSRWIAGSCIFFGLSAIAFSQSRSFWLSVLLAMPVGGFMTVQMSGSNTFIQSMVPDRLRGRVMAVFTMMFLGLAPFGSLYAGAFAKPLGAPMTMAIAGAMCVAGGILFWRALPQIREEARRLLNEQGTKIL